MDTWPPGLVYAGQAGATRQPSGRRSDSTLLSRIGANHLRGSVGASTWRLALASILAAELSAVAIARPWDRASESALTTWMQQHLSVITVPIADEARLAALEREVLHRLDPPLNLDGMPATPLRSTLPARRRTFGLARHA